MPKKVRRDKRGSSTVSSGAVGNRRRPDSVKDLLARRAPTLMRVTAQAARANFWSEWLSKRLPAEISPRISGVVERDETLVIFAESAAWSARLRFAVQELEREILSAASGLSGVVVRVRPRD
jgi:predicted nucleic acid-binding Zn ribbon protein